MITKSPRNKIRRDESELSKSCIYAFELSHINNGEMVSTAT